MPTHEDSRSLANLKRFRDGLPQGHERRVLDEVIAWLDEYESCLRSNEYLNLLRSHDFYFYATAADDPSPAPSNPDGAVAWVYDNNAAWNRIRWQMVLDAGRLPAVIQEWNRQRADATQSAACHARLDWTIAQFSSPTPVWA